MPRNSGNADRLMLEAGKEIISKEGCSGLRVRELVKRAGVNLGMFHYHFQTKERFKEAVLQEMYDIFFEKISIASKEHTPTTIGQLRNTLLAVGDFVRSKNEHYLAIFKDILNGDEEVIDFVVRNGPRHMAVIRELAIRCQREGSIDSSIPFPQIMAFIMTSANFPTLIGAVVRKNYKGRMKPQSMKAYEREVLSNKAIAQRIDFALKGLSP
jgi:AcrR family transcriptional regulator